ncbi:SEC-C domain-containing protein [Nocardioides sp. TRM66260-LWL]|uniref:DUF5926 family protein n=1 Tax=Nocardioides sp. TRM66260-LWL TaxID=2874478 RepID=UPI001CC3553D|nr:DUF5926 family protein [Nocardioides sp. TRM66260-LWL]MBZ5735962.1 SEC-C domain-containing protein [Nocardioides sp. TRM66260-LWL]
MAKKSRVKARESAPAAAGEVGPRQPCPCGSGKRYKACHGAPGGASAAFVARPFEGLPGECDLVALREFVPAGTATLTLAEGVAPERDDRSVLLASLLPGAAPALVREDGSIWLGLQVQHAFGDPARDLGAVLERSLAQAASGEPGTVGLTSDPGPGARLQDLVADEPLSVTVHDGFAYWVSDVEESPELVAALQQADESIYPTARLTTVEAAYWTNVGSKEHLRWVRPEPEDALLTALARLHAAGADRLVPEGRFVGMFRARGLLTPVWDLPVGTGAEALEEPVAALDEALNEALADESPLTAEQRSARSGLATRQVTIR